MPAMERIRSVKMILRVALAVWILITGIYITAAYAEMQEKKAQPVESQNFEERWGIKILSIRLTAGGYMLDFRYSVGDAQKASPIFSRKINPYLIDQTSGAKFMVPESPKVGALRQTKKPVAGKNYFIMFANPGQYIKKGNKVTVVIGDFKAENLTVQ
jgi:hypothetical protein